MVFGENLADLAQFHFRADGNDLFFRNIPYPHCHELLCAFLEIRQLLQGGGIDKQRLHIRKKAQDIPIGKEADQVLAAICDRHAADFLFCDEVQSIADRGFFGNGINLLLHDGKQRRLRCFFFRNTENRVSLCTAFFCNPAQLHADQNGGGNRTDADTAERM